VLLTWKGGDETKKKICDSPERNEVGTKNQIPSFEHQDLGGIKWVGGNY
jgi:hypothetical protein